MEMLRYPVIYILIKIQDQQEEELAIDLHLGLHVTHQMSGWRYCRAYVSRQNDIVKAKSRNIFAK